MPLNNFQNEPINFYSIDLTIDLIGITKNKALNNQCEKAMKKKG